MVTWLHSAGQTDLEVWIPVIVALIGLLGATITAAISAHVQLKQLKCQHNDAQEENEQLRKDNELLRQAIQALEKTHQNGDTIRRYL